MSTIDIIDIKILQVLQTNSRISFSELGRNVGISATAARNRVRALMQRGIITRLGAVLSLSKIGWQIQTLLLIQTEHGKTEAVMKQLRRLPQVLTITRTAGSVDLVVRVVARDYDQFIDLFHKVLSEISGILNINTLMVLDELNSDPPVIRVDK